MDKLKMWTSETDGLKIITYLLNIPFQAANNFELKCQHKMEGPSLEILCIYKLGGGGKNF